MDERTIQRVSLWSFVIAVITIVLGVCIGILGVWQMIPREGGLLWKVLGTDGILFAGAVFTNLAIACYRKPGGDLV